MHSNQNSSPQKESQCPSKVGTEPDFLLLVKNNLQDPTVAKPSKMAGKYMCYGNGEISDLFFKSGIKYNASEMYRLANNYDYKEESVSEVTENRECSIAELQKRADQSVLIFLAGANFWEKHAKNCAFVFMAHSTYTIAH